MTALLSSVGLLALMWAGDWLEDEHGRFAVNGAAIAFTVAAAAVGGGLLALPVVLLALA